MGTAKGRNVTPEGRRARYSTEPPNPKKTVYTGPFLVRQDHRAIRLRGRLALTWFPYSGLRFQGTTGRSERESLELSKPAILEVPSTHLHIPVLLTSSNGLLPAGMRYEGEINKSGLAGTPTHATMVEFQLTNFHSFIGDSIRFGQMRTRGRLILRAHGWEVTIDQQPQHRELHEKLRRNGGYGITHVGILSRTNSGLISKRVADDHLTTLHYFLAFCCGAWCGPILTTAYQKEREVWNDWASWKLTPWAGRQSWFPTSHPHEVGSFYGMFRRKWMKPVWKRTFTAVIHWYVQANAHSDTLETSIITAFAALEALAWLYIVEDKQLVAPNTFDGRSAAARITRLLNELSIPVTIPNEYVSLQRAALHRHASNGPTILAKVRNDLIHPKAKRRAMRNALFETKSLSLTYIELAILSILRYDGKYTRRLIEVTRAEATIAVPWTS